MEITSSVRESLKSKLPGFTRIQMVVHIIAWLLVIALIWDYFTGNLTVNPIQAAQQRTGRFAIYFLIFSLACTPLNTVFKFRQALSARRSAGLYAYLFAVLHLFLFIGADYGFEFRLILEDVGSKRYILAGVLAFLLLTPLALTSFQWWMRKLGKNWKRLHKLVYFAGVVAVFHFAWAKKGDVFSLQGDIQLPALLGGLVLILLLLRLPPARRKAVEIRQKVEKRYLLSERRLQSK